MPDSSQSGVGLLFEGFDGLQTLLGYFAVGKGYFLDEGLAIVLIGVFNPSDVVFGLERADNAEELALGVDEHAVVGILLVAKGAEDWL